MSTPRIKDAGHIARMYGYGQRFFTQYLLDRPLLSMLRRDLKSYSTFNWQYQGHDPRNHHGRFMYDIVQNYTQKFRGWLIVDDHGAVSYDPRNHKGARL